LTIEFIALKILIYRCLWGDGMGFTRTLISLAITIKKASTKADFLQKNNPTV